MPRPHAYIHTCMKTYNCICTPQICRHVFFKQFSLTALIYCHRGPLTLVPPDDEESFDNSLPAFIMSLLLPPAVVASLARLANCQLRLQIQYVAEQMSGATTFPWESWLIRSPHTRKILGSNPSGDTFVMFSYFEWFSFHSVLGLNFQSFCYTSFWIIDSKVI